MDYTRVAIRAPAVLMPLDFLLEEYSKTKAEINAIEVKVKNLTESMPEWDVVQSAKYTIEELMNEKREEIKRAEMLADKVWHDDKAAGRKMSVTIDDLFMDIVDERLLERLQDEINLAQDFLRIAERRLDDKVCREFHVYKDLFPLRIRLENLEEDIRRHGSEVPV